MTHSIREKLIAAGIIIPAEKRIDNMLIQDKGVTCSANTKKSKPKITKKQYEKSHNNDKSQSKDKLSRVDRAISLASYCGRRGSSYQLQPENIRLFVRRGVVVKGEDAVCGSCGSSSGIITRYSDTNVGPIAFCTICKVKVFEANFGHADAMPLTVNHAHAQRNR